MKRKTYRDEHGELLDALRKGIEDFGKLTPHQRFRRLIDDGLIDEEGRLRPEITGLPEADEQPGPSGK